MRKLLAAILALLAAPIIWTWDGLRWVARRMSGIPAELDQPTEAEVELAQARAWTPREDARPGDAEATLCWQYAAARRHGDDRKLPHIVSLPLNVQEWLKRLSPAAAKRLWIAGPYGVEGHLSGRAPVEYVPMVPPMAEAAAKAQRAFERAQAIIRDKKAARDHTLKILEELAA